MHRNVPECDKKYGKTPNYFRYSELEQDIASMAGILVFIKLVHGLTDYPYLFQCQMEELETNFNVGSV